jgi:hypothetical protein
LKTKNNNPYSPLSAMLFMEERARERRAFKKKDLLSMENV